MSWKAVFFALILISSVSVIPLAFSQMPPVTIFQSPKKQIEQGVQYYNVKCNVGLVLMKKLSDNSPACVKPDTSQKLVERHWGATVNPNTFPYNTLENSTTGTMNITNTKFSANYTITNAQILGIRADVQSLSTIVTIHTNSDGNLIITIPTALIIDPRIANPNDQPLVLGDGMEINFKELKKTSTYQTLSIPFTDGITEIEIIGTNLT
ncbi:MAG: hypothetical protein AUF74_02000 [Thaumarchaeota archaeon 13_1_20CM_2_38_5]|nr:MAG: hypothetical protein AUF74_02000 [Thaumarchaeota archaeon 13_1_20CM_2_38_5]